MIMSTWQAVSCCLVAIILAIPPLGVLFRITPKFFLELVFLCICSFCFGTKQQQHNMEVFRCRHVCCSHIDHDAMRLPYKSAKARNKHERKKVHHRLCDPAICSTCSSLGKPIDPKRVPLSKEEGHPCGHTNGCSKVYASHSNAVRHELNDAHTGCLQPCPRCNAAKNSLKRKREAEEAAELAAQEAMLQQKKAENAHLAATLQNIDWEEALLAKDLQELKQKQAEVRTK